MSNLLLIDSTSSKIEFAAYVNEQEIFRYELDSTENADTLIYRISLLAKENSFPLSDLNFVSIANGPGSFTGLRISSAIAKALCFSSGAKLIEINSLDILANKSETDKQIVSLIFSNMRTKEFYYAKYKKDETLERISEYETGVLEDIFNKEDFFISSNEVEGFDLHCSGSSSLDSLKELTGKYILQNKFSDYNISEPFYMKDFVPLKSQKKLL